MSAFDTASSWNVEREHLWVAGWRMFRDHPITGVGLQDLHPLIERYRPPGARESHGHLHSVYVQIGATMGIVGIAAFAWLVWGLFRTAGGGLRAELRASASGTRIEPGAGARAGGEQAAPDVSDALGLALRVGAVAALTGFLVSGLFEWNFGDEELLDFLFTLVGIALAAGFWNRRCPAAPPSS
jgi:O-antigen ligase